MKNIAIVGFGCAGYHALRAIREIDQAARIHVYSDCPTSVVNPMLTTYYTSGKLPYEGLFPFGTLEEIADRFDADIRTGSAVSALDAESRTLSRNGEVCGPYDAILLATGAAPIVPPLGVTPGQRVLCMRTASDAQLLKERLDRGDIRTATVIGASMVGIKVIELLTERSVDCTLADMADRIFPLSAFPDVSEEIGRRLQMQNVALRLGAAVTGAQETESSVTTHFESGEPITSDLLILCIGTRANISLAKDAGIGTGRGILVDSHMETSAPFIYAAGDCCEAKELFSGDRQIIGLWANAAFQGEAAGRCIAGTDSEFSGNIVHNITHFMGMDFISLGDINAQGDIYSVGQPDGQRYIKAVFRDGELLCVNMLDSYHISGVVKNYMLNRLTGNRSPLPPVLRGLLAKEGFTEEFLTLFEGGANA